MNKTYCKNVIKDLNKKYLLYKIVNSNFKFYKDVVNPNNKLSTVRDLILYIKYKNIPIPNIVLQYTDLYNVGIFKILNHFNFICIILIDKEYYKIINVKDNVPILYFEIQSRDFIQYSESAVSQYISKNNPKDISIIIKNTHAYLNDYIFERSVIHPDLYSGGKL